jgi:2-hydroxy-3-oxopropionate reductase
MQVGMQVGFIGLGIMGQPMARNLLKAGFPLVVATRTPGKAAAFAKDNAALGNVQAAETPAQVAAVCDIIVNIVTDTPDVVEVAYGETGLFATAKPGTIIIDMSTISPSVTRDLAAKASKQELFWLDAPVSGGEKGAIEGTLTIMVGGADAAVAKATPVLNAMGKRITHFGAPGNGQAAKLCNQIMVAVNLMAVCETMTFARKAGLDLNLLHQALTGGAANSWALDVLGKKMIDRDFKPAFMVKLQQKDLRLVMDAANRNHTALPAAGLAHQMLAAVEAEGRGDDGTQSLVRIFERLAGLAE